MKNIETYQSHADLQNMVARMFKSLRVKISNIFEPEEVEVTFEGEGNDSGYTYTKVSEKQVA